ncbi:rhodanese-like domain-containing protein [Marinicella rhabdoformis]|uniref:rhodanese-like domain-containing protein n=1 Tax=Marinicella rhabdoformis TaxID=2580566 RepID=UPI0012AED425|nr:rhodanese-like domain-containing protein [Marinicella rhabdoformis]
MAQLAEFIGNHIFLVTLFLAALFLFLISAYKQASNGLQTVTVEQMTRLVNQQNAKLIDVRPAEAFAQGHIVNAVNIPMADIEAGKIKTDGLKKRPVVIYCQMGRTSLKACQAMKNAGIETTFSLQGGVNAWLNDKMPLSK